MLWTNARIMIFRITLALYLDVLSQLSQRKISLITATPIRLTEFFVFT